MYLYSSAASWIEGSGVVRTNGKPAVSCTRREMAGLPLRKLLDADAYPHSLGIYNRASTKLTAGRVGFLESNAEIAGRQNFTWTLRASITAGADSLLVTSVGGGMRQFTESNGWMFSVPVAVFTIDSEKMLVCRRDGYPQSGPAAVTMCPGGRGAWGAAATSRAADSVISLQHTWHSDDYTVGWVVLAWRLLATMADAQTDGYSGREAYERATVLVSPPTGISGSSGSPQWAFQPARDPSNSQALAVEGGVRLMYNAPDLTACRYFVAASFSGGSDVSDTSDGGGSPTREMVVGVVGSGAFEYRISCGSGRAVGRIKMP